jgi:hypothetical protein
LAKESLADLFLFRRKVLASLAGATYEGVALLESIIADVITKSRASEQAVINTCLALLREPDFDVPYMLKVPHVLLKTGEFLFGVYEGEQGFETAQKVVLWAASLEDEILMYTRNCLPSQRVPTMRVRAERVSTWHGSSRQLLTA